MVSLSSVEFDGPWEEGADRFFVLTPRRAIFVPLLQRCSLAAVTPRENNELERQHGTWLDGEELLAGWFASEGPLANGPLDDLVSVRKFPKKVLVHRSG